MDTHLIMRRQQDVLRDKLSVVELLAMLILGGIAMTFSLVGLEWNDPVLYWIGLVILIAAAGYIIVKFLNELLTFINRVKNKLC